MTGEMAKGFGKRQPSPSSHSLSLAPYVRTLPVVIEAMLKLGQVGQQDHLYDLGCGDGRILLTAARLHGSSGVGVDIDPARIREARQQARELGLEAKVQFRQHDLMTLDLSAATVVTLYLLPRSHLLLREKLRRELRPGSRILAHSFDLGDWIPDATAQVKDAINTYPIFLWRV